MESLLTHIDVDSHVTKFVAAAAVVIIVAVTSQLFSSFRVQRALKRYPIINEKWDSAAKKHFSEQASKLVDEGSALAKGNPFRLNDKGRQRLVLPPKYIDEIKNDNRLDFHGFVANEFHSTTPGFDAFSSSVDQTIFQNAVRTQLTQALALTVEPMAKEAPNTLNIVFGDAPEWKEVVLIPSLLRCISRLTALIFLGEKFMNNPDWQRISVMYTVDAFMAAKALNDWPAPLRPIVHWFMPECKKIREEVKIARALITPEVEKRRRELVENGGKPRRKVLDSVDWFTASAKGADFDYVGAELSLSMASIHTTNNTLSFAIFDLVQHPEYFKPLREEILRVYNEEGKWEKSTLFKLKLMDSFLKESMRYNPHTVLNMPRQATEDLTLKDGTLIPKSTFIYIGPQPMKDPKNFPSPETFDGYRFLKLRDAPGAENKHQFVTTAPEITVFGHGHHSCPGRFFASNELKLLLAHMIMYYDWKLPDGQTVVPPTINGTSRSPNSRQKVLYKSRTCRCKALPTPHDHLSSCWSLKFGFFLCFWGGGSGGLVWFGLNC